MDLNYSLTFWQLYGYLSRQRNLFVGLHPVDVDLARTAIGIVDMHNAFVREGGHFDIIGVNIDKFGNIVMPCQKAINAAPRLFLDDQAIIVSDAVSPMGPDMLQEAILANVHSKELISGFHRAANRRPPSPSP